MNILINCSNLRTGGGLQVADSICRELERLDNDNFVVVLPQQLKDCANAISEYHNVSVFIYNQPISIGRIIFGKDSFLDELIYKYNISSAITLFGPSRWRPKCKHICGFAMAHLVLGDSPYWKLLSAKDKLKSRLRIFLMKRDFGINNDGLWCENEYISQKLRALFRKKEVATITNNCNQVFDNPAQWDSSIKLPAFDGLTLLTVTADYPHKNIRIAILALQAIKQTHPSLSIRFVYTVTKEQLGDIPKGLEKNFEFLGPVKINQVPPLYQQSDVMFQPSLLECFSASYAEAMKMGVPIITTDLGFAHSLCGDAALYYSPVDADDLANKIVQLFKDKSLSAKLIKAGSTQLTAFNSFSERADKLIALAKSI